MKKFALFSLNIPDRVERFARDLSNLGWRIIATRETYNILIKNKLPVIDIADFVDIKKEYSFPPSLHPKIEACLTLNGDVRIDLVYVIPYPLSKGNDVGGRTLLALAAKGGRIPVMSITDMELVISDLQKNGNISKNLHQSLINKTNALIASHYDDLIKQRNPYDILFGTFRYNLKSGENPYQVPAALFSTKHADSLSLSNFKQLSGDPPCFVNLADSDCIIYTMCLISEAFKLRYRKIPYVCISAKHGNPCGIGASWDTPNVAVNKALLGNPRAIWGGEIVVNFTIDEIAANMLYKSNRRQEILGDAAWMLDVILAPAFTLDAIKILGQRKNRKLFENKALKLPFLPKYKYMYRFIRGGFLRQPRNNFIIDFSDTELFGSRINKHDIDSLIIAWAAAWSSSHGGNEIALAKEMQLLSVGGGPSTVESAMVAVNRAKDCGHELSNSVFAANAFFPFTDAPEVLVNVKPSAGLVPKGGSRMDVIRDFFLKKGVSMVYLKEEYRGFCRH